MARPDFGQLWKSTRGPAWRQAWARSLHLQQRPGREVDPLVVQLHEYHGAAADDRRHAAEQHPLLAAAEQVDASQQLVGTLQLLVLAGATPAEVAQRSGLDVEVVSHWMDLSFDVGDFRRASGWLYTFVIETTRVAQPRLAAQMRAALSGGLPVVDQLLAAESQSPSDPVARQQQHRTRLAMRCDQALDQLPDSAATDLQLVKLMPSFLRAQRPNPMRRTASSSNTVPLPTAPLLALRWALPPNRSMVETSGSLPIVPFAADDMAASADFAHPSSQLHSA